MRLDFFAHSILLATAGMAKETILARQDETDNLQVLEDLGNAAYGNAIASLSSTDGSKRGSTCTLSNLKIRREWGALSKQERRSYIDAVLCLQSTPAKTPESLAAGAKTRFDDFVATHVNQTLTIHYTGVFLSWHRYFIWLYEQALQQECGYNGTQPYWNWGITAATGLAASPIFDGSDTSLSGDGAPIANQSDIVLAFGGDLGSVYIPPGSGGGCVTSGPFRNLTVHLGPGGLAQPGGTTGTSANPLDDNPRCFRRSLTDESNQAYANASSIVSNILGPDNIYDFQMQMQGVPGSGDIGVHGGGHYSLGGDPGDDFYTSPGDPAFYLHHGMIDRTWWIWQSRDPANRVSADTAVAGTNTYLNDPPSANTTLEDYVSYGYTSGPSRQLQDLMSTTGGPFCYVYV